MTLSVLKENIEYLEKKGKKVAKPSYDLAMELESKLKKQGL